MISSVSAVRLCQGEGDSDDGLVETQPSRGHTEVAQRSQGMVGRSPYHEERTGCPRSQAAYEVGR